ncbi:hypothetical protein [Tessaracoccus sp. OH4464_COT-324]|uniref:hypothetical protein n=1 Tax=Tessaracoccus sp. OH4464_COT-324 TaxID=2491059 RepID=UPI000F644014|nr:hypothetical protein [Tessaracoccus sp. OH4464_COT-324]RRD45283.1 hypothetical protein EII42_11040 [Tessaracoccus sp. OH4464_COT-324]
MDFKVNHDSMVEGARRARVLHAETFEALKQLHLDDLRGAVPNSYTEGAAAQTSSEMRDEAGQIASEWLDYAKRLEKTGQFYKLCEERALQLVQDFVRSFGL